MTTTSLPAGSPAAELLSVQQVAALLNCSARHVHRLSDAGKMPSPVRLNWLVRWPRSQVVEWVQNGCQPVRVPGRKAGA